MSQYHSYGSQPSNIPVTPVDYLEQMAPSPYHEHYSPRRPPTQRPQMYERYNGAMNVAPSMGAAADVAIPSSDAAAVKELQQIKYILIGVAVLILLLLILRR